MTAVVQMPGAAGGKAWWPAVKGSDSLNFADKGERGKAMVDAARNIEALPQESTRADVNIAYARMFEAMPLSSIYQYGGKYYGPYGGGGMSTFSLSDRSTWNCMRSVIMTAAALIARSRPRVRFAANGGKYEQRNRAKQLTQFTDGLFAEGNLYELTQEAFVDSAVFDAGAVQPYVQDGRIRFQRILSPELAVDPVEAFMGMPRSLYRRRWLDKDQVYADYGDTPERKSAIGRAQTSDPLGMGGGSTMIVVREAWHLPAGEETDDGLHMVALDHDGTDLVGEGGEPWKRPYFPIPMLFWQRGRSGMWGNSLAQQCAPIQVEINRMLAKAERVERIHATGRVGMQRGSKIVKTYLNDVIGAVVESTGAPPQVLAQPYLPPEFYIQLERHVQRMFDLAGISRQQASGVKDEGVKSGAAIRESLDVQQANFALTEQRWENFHLQIARVSLDLIRDLVADGKSGYAVQGPDKSGRTLSQLDWKEVGLDEKDYVMGRYPASILPLTPAARKDTVAELVSSGLWTKERGLAALDDLDVEAGMSLERAAEQDLERILEGIVYKGKWEPPEPYHNLQLAVLMAAKYIQLAKIEGCPPRNIDLARQWFDDVSALRDKLMPPPPPAAMPAAA